MLHLFILDSIMLLRISKNRLTTKYNLMQTNNKQKRDPVGGYPGDAVLLLARFVTYCRDVEHIVFLPQKPDESQVRRPSSL